jgi:hypothetical protein
MRSIVLQTWRKMSKSLLMKWGAGCGIKKGPGFRGRGPGERSAFGGQLSAEVLAPPLSGGSGWARNLVPASALTLTLSQRERELRSAPRPLAPKPWPLNSIAALRPPSAAFESNPETFDMTKNTIKQAPNASEVSAGEVQLQR